MSDEDPPLGKVDRAFFAERIAHPDRDPSWTAYRRLAERASQM